MVDRASFGTVTYEGERRVDPLPPLVGTIVPPVETGRKMPSTNGLVRRQVDPRPEGLGRPRLRWSTPERVAGGQSQREETHGAQVGAPRGDVALADLRLMASEPYREPTCSIEGARRAHRAADHGAHRSPYLRRPHALW